MGHFDSMSDVTNALVIQNCAGDGGQDLTWFSVWGHRFNLPADLGAIMIFGVVLIALFQALPGLLLVVFNRQLEAALKLNEHTMVLAAADAEVSPLDAEE